MIVCFRRIFSISLCLLVSACGSGKGRPNISEENETPGPDIAMPATWIQYTARDLFSFYGPADLEEIAVQPIDSFVGQYKNPTLMLHFDYGWYSGTLEEFAPEPGYRRSKIEVDGRTAELVATRDKLGLVVPKVKRTLERNGPAKLTFWIECSSPAAHTEARQILESIRFPD